MADDTTLTVGGSTLSGWTDVRVTRRIEGCPNDFEISFTERYPGQPDDFVVQAGDLCVVAIDGDTVITGYIDRFSRGYSGESHTVSVSGRGKTQDLVDASAEWPGGQIAHCNALTLAQKLAKPYGITVTCLNDPGPEIPQFNLNLGDTAFEIIERTCRWVGLLAYEGTDGNLILANTSKVQAACGFTEGINVQSADVVSAMDQRFSEYVCALSSTDVLDDQGSGGNTYFTATDPNVKRHRRTYFIAEAPQGGQDVCKQRALWEAARRAGRGFNTRITTDSWRDSGGALWAPNTQAPISLPNLKLDGVTWTIGEVTYRRNAKGTACDMMMMDGAAFTAEPILLVPTFADQPAGIGGAPGG